MTIEYPVERYARLRLTGREFSWRTGKVIPDKPPLEQADPLDAYVPFLFETMEAAQRAHAKDMVALWGMVDSGAMSPDDAYAVDDVMGIFKCSVDQDGRIFVFDPGHRLPTIAEQRAFADRRFGPEGEFEITREAAFAAHEVADPLLSSSPAI